MAHIFGHKFWVQLIGRGITLLAISSIFLIPSCCVSPIFKAPAAGIRCGRNLSQEILFNYISRSVYLNVIPRLLNHCLAHRVQSYLVWRFSRNTITDLMVSASPWVTDEVVTATKVNCRDEQVVLKQLVNDSSTNCIHAQFSIVVEREVFVNIYFLSYLAHRRVIYLFISWVLVETIWVGHWQENKFTGL